MGTEAQGKADCNGHKQPQHMTGEKIRMRFPMLYSVFKLLQKDEIVLRVPLNGIEKYNSFKRFS